MSGLPLPCTAAEHLALAAGQVGRDLVSPEAWRRLRAIRDVLPPAAEDAAIEVRLEDADPRADFALCLRARGLDRRGLLDALVRSGAAADSVGWRRALDFLDAWARDDSVLHRTVPALWLEFDAEGPGAPEPFLIFALDGERLYADGTCASERLLSLVVAGLDPLGQGLGPRTRAALERCLRGLPRNAQVLHAALRPTATGDAIRLIVRMPWRRLAAALADLAWPGEPAALHAMLEQLCPDTLVHSMNLDIFPEGLGPRLGIEFVHLGSPRESPRWQTLFDALESLGACAPGRRAAIADWGGERLGPPLGPGRLCLRRDLMLKAVYETGRPLRAKAYLAFAPRLVVREGLAEEAARASVQESATDPET